MNCKICKQQAAVSLQSHNAAFCGPCYLRFFRRQLRRGIEHAKLFTKEDRILVALSGGKDSLSLMLELHEMGYNVAGMFIDLGIPDSSAAALSLTRKFCAQYGLDLRVIDLAGEELAIPDVKRYLRRPVCSVCGKIKRHYFNKALLDGGYDVLATGHNLDDESARLLSNVMRWDADYLASQGPLLEAENGFGRKVKPLWRLTEFETANYAFLRGIDYHWQPCPYSKGASFSILKNFMRGLEAEMPGRKLDFYQGFLERGKAAFAAQIEHRDLTPCAICGYPTSNGGICGVCGIRQIVKERKEKFSE